MLLYGCFNQMLNHVADSTGFTGRQQSLTAMYMMYMCSPDIIN